MRVLLSNCGPFSNPADLDIHCFLVSYCYQKISTVSDIFLKLSSFVHFLLFGTMSYNGLSLHLVNHISIICHKSFISDLTDKVLIMCVNSGQTLVDDLVQVVKP